MRWFPSHMKKHFVEEVHQLWVFPQHLLKSLIFNDPMFIPCSTMQRNILLLTLPTHWGQIKYLVPFLVSHVKSFFKISILRVGLTIGTGTILHHGIAIRTFCFGEILYFSRISPLLFFVWVCTILIVLSNDKWSFSIWVVSVENC